MPIGAMAHRRPAGLPPACAGCARSSRSTRPAARPTSASACRNREGINARLPADGDRQRPDVGDHEPAHRRRSGRGHGRRRADGQRPGRAPAGSAPTATRPRQGEAGAGGSTAAAPRRAGPPGRQAEPPQRDRSRRRSRSSSSPRRGGGAGSPRARRVLDAARALGVDIDSVCGGRGLCGRCQVAQGVGEFAKHGITSRAGAPVAARRARGRLPRARGARRRTAASRCTAHAPRRRRHRRPAREPGPPPGRAQGPRPSATSRSTRSSASTTSRWRRRSSPRRRATSRGCSTALGARVGPDRPRGRPRGHPRRSSRRSTTGDWTA